MSFVDQGLSNGVFISTVRPSQQKLGTRLTQLKVLSISLAIGSLGPNSEMGKPRRSGPDTTTLHTSSCSQHNQYCSMFLQILTVHDRGSASSSFAMISVAHYQLLSSIVVVPLSFWFWVQNESVSRISLQKHRSFIDEGMCQLLQLCVTCSSTLNGRGKIKKQETGPGTEPECQILKQSR